ncbi:MAG: D-alanyl-D-alanine carboxypeptidase [Chitinophagaceae bacterium]|nr:D-alanyl-D-alanine carboxypeptidase [Chitinophagaceae bacterium]
MKKLFIPIVLITALSSCSMTQKINREAKSTVLNKDQITNYHMGIAVYDPETSKMVYEYQADKYFMPASNTKLASCYVAMKYLGDSLTGIQYEVVDGSTVKIRGMADPTVMHPDFPNQPVYNFLKNYKNVEIEKTNFSSFLGNGWSWDDYPYSYAAPRSAFPMYGDYVTLKFDNNKVTTTPSWFRTKTTTEGNITNGITVTRPWSENSFTVSGGKSKKVEYPFIPDDNTVAALWTDVLGTQVKLTDTKVSSANYVYTQPLDSMLAIMMHRSDNLFAEQSLLMVSDKLLGTLNTRQIIQKILETDFAGMPQKPRWVDGSGLSSYNLFTPKDFIFILEKLKNEFGMERLKVILPTGGTGTLSSLYHEDTGKIFAKTGTISGVVTLSGYLITEKNKLLLFSVLVNNHNTAAQDVRKSVEKFLHAIRTKL